MKGCLISLLCAVCALVLAMDGPVKRAKKPRHKKALKLRQANTQMEVEHIAPVEMPYLPLEVFIEIFVFIFDMTSLKRTFIDPILPYKLVSWSWYEYCKSDEFQSYMMKHPRMALLKLRLSHDIERNGNIDLLHTCKDLVNVETSRKLVLKAKSTTVFEQLWILPIFRSTSLSGRAYKRLLINAVNKGVIGRPLVPPITQNFEDDPRSVIEIHLESLLDEPALIIDQVDLVQLLKLAYFDDMFRPNELSYPFQLINHQITIAYHTGQQAKVKHVLDAIRLVFLPHRAENLMYVCMEYSAFIAAYIGDQEFLKFISLDYEAIMMCSGVIAKEDEVFVGALSSVQSGEAESYPVGALPAVKELFESNMFDEQLGFDRRRIVARSEEILEDPLVSEEIKRIVFEHLYQHLRDLD